MSQAGSPQKVLVTGATGYVAGWIVKKLLSEGHTVHAAVRDPFQESRIQHLKELARDCPGRLIFFQSDLLKDGSYEEAMKGCEVVFHTASPFIAKVADPQKELIEPAKMGTRNVLETARKVGGVRRVVVTSSCAAIYGDNLDIEKTPNGIFTEEIWNTSSSWSVQPYSYSKTLAEREAWEIARTQSEWDLVTINPSLVIGPGINPNATSESFNIIAQMGDGTMRFGAPRLGIGVVDVRDLAEAHYQAAFRPEASGRYIVSGHNTDIYEMAQALIPRYGKKYPLPKMATPKWLIWLVGPLMNPLLDRRYINANVGIAWKADNSKSIRELGVSYRPLKDSMNDFFAQLIEAGRF